MTAQNESLPAKLRELAELVLGAQPLALLETHETLRAAAERIEEQEVQARAMYSLPAELAAMKAERDAARGKLKKKLLCWFGWHKSRAVYSTGAIDRITGTQTAFIYCPHCKRHL